MFEKLMQWGMKERASNTKHSQRKRKETELKELTMKMKATNQQNDIEKKKQMRKQQSL